MPTERKARKYRRWILLAAVLIVAVGIHQTARYYTSPERVAALARTVVEDLTGATLEIGNVEVDLSRGVTFYDLTVSLPAEKLDRQGAGEQGEAALLKVKSVRVVFDRNELFKLAFRAKQILVDGAEVYVTRREGQNRWNWQELFDAAVSKDRPSTGFAVGPTVKINDGQLLIGEFVDGEYCRRGRVGFSAEALPRGQLYEVTIKSAVKEIDGPQVCFEFDPQASRVVSGRMTPIDWQGIEAIIPEPYRDLCRRLDPAGTFEVTQTKASGGGRAEIVLKFQGVRARIPLSKKEWEAPQRRWFINVDELAGRVVVTDDQIRLDELSGKVNGAQCRITGVIDVRRTNVRDSGFDLQLVARGFVSPDYLDPADREMIETVLPRKLRHFLNDFKPKGKFDMDLAISRQAGPDEKVSVSGRIQPDQVSAEFRKFPYRLDGISGTVELVKGGGFVLKDLTGESTGNAVTVNGTVSEPSRHAEIELSITTEKAPLDEKLFRALPPRYQRIWQMFNPSGHIAVRTHLVRSAGAEGKWKRDIDIELLNAALCYERFKYPLEEVSGRLTIVNRRLLLDQLKGRHGRGEVTISGVVEDHHTAKASSKFQLGAKNITIDEDLIAALPTAAGQMIRDCRLKGKCDLVGWLKIEPGRPWQYDLNCDLTDASVRHKDFPYPLEGLKGQLVITPDQVEIKNIKMNGNETENVFGADDARAIRANGRVRFGQAGERVDLTIDADNLPLDSRLFNVLNDRQQSFWRKLSPTGRIDVHVQLSRSAKKQWTWRTDVNFDQTAMGPAKLPGISHMGGKVILDGRQAILESVTGKTETGAAFTCSGKIFTTDTATRAELALTIKDLPITAELLESAGGREVFSALKLQPGGSFSANLDRLEIDIPHGDDENRQWSFQGAVDLKGASIETLAVGPADLLFRGTGQWISSTSRFALNGDAKLSRFDWRGRTVSDLSSRLVKRIDDPVLTLTDLSGRVGKGEVAGQVELKFLPDQTRYAMQLTLKDVPTAKILLIGTQASKSEPIRGRMQGEVSLIGTLGRKHPDRGGGQIRIWAAEVLKVPLFARVYKAVKRKPPNLASFHDVRAEFILDKHMMDLRRIELEGTTLSMVGYGWINLSNDRLKLHLIFASPRRLRDIPLIKEILHRASEDLTEVEVAGPLNDPTVKATPLRHLSDALRSFLEGKHVRHRPRREFPENR